MGIHDKAINIFSLKLKPAKHINTNVKEIRTNSARLIVATQMPTQIKTNINNKIFGKKWFFIPRKSTRDYLMVEVP